MGWLRRMLERLVPLRKTVRDDEIATERVHRGGAPAATYGAAASSDSGGSDAGGFDAGGGGFDAGGADSGGG